ncbi:NF-kappa-B inhibitor zeta-like isoform X3 [Anolis carolinensis]
MPTPYGQVSAPESQSPWIERVGNPPSEEHWESIPFQPRSPDISWHPFGCGAMEGCPTPTNIFRNQCEEERRWQKVRFQVLTKDDPPGNLILNNEGRTQKPCAGSFLKQEVPKISLFQFQLQQEEARLRNISMEKLLEPDPHGNRPLHGAVTQGRRALAYALAWRMAYLNKIDEKDTAKQTALHIAARKNHQLIAGDLIALGANVNAKDILGKTPLHLCAEKGNLAVLEVLQSCQQNGTHVEVDVTNNQGLTPLQGGALAHAALVKDLEIPGLSLDIKQVLALRKDRILRGICCLVEMGADPWVQGTTSSDQTSHCFAKMQEDKELMNAFQIYGPRRTQESGSLRNRDALQCLQAERIDSPAVLFSKLLDQFLGPSLM